MPAELQNAVISSWTDVGEIPQLGSLQLTLLAQSFEEIAMTPLGDLFPDRLSPEREVIIEQVIEGLGIMKMVRPGVPSGNFLEPSRVRRFRVQPAFFREDDYLDQVFINQLKRVGTMNEAYPVEQLIADRVQRMVDRHRRVKDMFQARVLTGGISYTDPDSGQSIDVSTNIPAHNFFSYDGHSTTVSAGSNIVPSLPYVAAKNLVNDKGRNESLFFTSSDGQAAVPWTHPRADIIRCLRLLQQYLYKTNKNRFTDLILSHELYTVIIENEYLRSFMGIPAVLVNSSNSAAAVSPGGTPVATAITMGNDGNIATIAGLRVRVIDGMYRDPVTNRIVNYWPSNKVAVVAARSSTNPNETLGMTYHCVGESPEGRPGLWMRTGPEQMPPAPPGRTMQIGDAFLPFAVYPHWISILTVCDPEELETRLILQSDLGYGTF